MSQNINPRVIGRLNKELKQLMSAPPEGVRFIPGDMDTLTEVYIEMDGPGKFSVCFLPPSLGGVVYSGVCLSRLMLTPD